MEPGKLWRSAFKGNLRLLELNLPGLEDGLAAGPPAPGVSAPAWVLGHLVYARHLVLRYLGAPGEADPIWKATYGRHSDGSRAHLPLSALVEAFRGTDEALKEALLAVSDWERPTLNLAIDQEQPLEQVVAFMHMHECYHLGQFGVFRKLLGLSGGL